MKNVVYFLTPLFLCVLLTGCAAAPAVEENIWDRPPNPYGAYGYDESLPDLLNIKGLTYHEARKIIMSAGWEPLQTLQEGTHDYEADAMSGDGKIVWSKGYHELQSCTGGGPAYCAFLFQSEGGDRLRVVAKGEHWDNSSSSAKVAGCRFNP